MNLWIELSRAAFSHNVATITRLARTSIGFVMKSNAYGHGFIEMLALAREHQEITWICVATISEGIRARALGWNNHILVMAAYDAPLELALTHDLVLAVTNFEQLARVDALTRAARIPLKIHLKIDTGMSRLGFLPHEVPAAVHQVRANSYVVLEGIFSHAADTAGEDYGFAHAQHEQFKEILNALRGQGFVLPNAHFYASGMAHEAPDYSFVRVGTALYGMFKSGTHYERSRAQLPDIALIPVMRIHARVCKRGDARVIPFGFAHGLPYQAAGIRVQNELSDFVMHEVGMYVTRLMFPFDRAQGKLAQHGRLLSAVHFSALDYATAAGTIPNEALCRLSPAIPRIVV